jgi:hypothetical protein
MCPGRLGATVPVMSQNTQDKYEVAPEELRELFDRLSQEHEGYNVTIEVVSRDLGDQYEAEKLPLAYLAYDEKDDTFIVAVGGRDGRYPVLRHMIEHPKQVMASTLDEQTPWAIDVVAADGTQTIVTLHRPPALPPPGQTTAAP